MPHQFHDRYGLTLGSEKSAESSQEARRIAYHDENYIENLQQILNGAVSPEDLLSALNLVWIPLGSTELTTTDSVFPIKNITDEFYMYRILITDIKSTLNNTSSSWNLSTDNGLTWIVGDSTKYSYVLWRQFGAGSVGRAWDNTADQAPLGVNTRLLDSASSAYIETVLINPGTSSFLTQGFSTFGFLESDSSSPGFTQMAECYWSSRVLEAHDAIGLRCSGGGQWTQGIVSVWGLERNG